MHKTEKKLVLSKEWINNWKYLIAGVILGWTESHSTRDMHASMHAWKLPPRMTDQIRGESFLLKFPPFNLGSTVTEQVQKDFMLLGC